MISIWKWLRYKSSLRGIWTFLACPNRPNCTLQYGFPVAFKGQSQENGTSYQLSATGENGDLVFEIGQIVRVKADPSRQGPVIATLPSLAGMLRYKVFHSARDTRDYAEDQLVAVETNPADGDGTIEWLDTRVFKAYLTASRLEHPQTDSLYAFGAARIKFNPFQFKPLLRFLKSDAQRLLIADEVGVGKTIEAGLILKELSARQKLKNVMIVCPKALTTKWQKEMQRFDESFKILTSESLGHCLRETSLEYEWPEDFSRSIVHLELLRLNDYMEGNDKRPGFFALPQMPRFSLLIVDEVHHARTINSNSNSIIRFLCECSEAVVFLSATPVHTGSNNLFSLLSLLRPEVFLDETVFNDMVEPNQFLLKAMRLIRSASQPNWIEDAAEALKNAASTSWGKRVLVRDPRFIECVDFVSPEKRHDGVSRIRCLRELEELNTLSMVMNRTRRRDIGKFTVRDPHTISVAFTPEQEQLYSAIIQFKKQVLALDYDPLVVQLVSDTLQRQAASCLPALLPAIDSFLRTGRFQLQKLTDVSENDSDETPISLPHNLVEDTVHIRKLVADLPSSDPKFAELRKIVSNAMSQDGPKKILVFSFFLHTLGYLQKCLAEAGYRVATINGSIEDSVREQLRDRFRLGHEDVEAIDVLLSSEVGCEGLDYEFCDVLVNYDIPWNPMRLEQRIGRVDRYGQKSDKVRIFNFVTPGTVEERIFFRCYERLGIFADTVGDLEEVLGDLVQEITRAAMNSSLTEEEAARLAQQATDNALRKVEEERRLESESNKLLGLDELLMQDISSMANTGRLVSADDLRQLVEQYLSKPAIQGTVKSLGSKRWRITIPDKGRRFLLGSIQNSGISKRQFRDFIKWLEGNEDEYMVTFEQEEAFEHRSLPFLTAIHPLVRFACKEWSERPDPLVTNCVLKTSGHVAEGRYLFACYQWEILGLRTDVRIVGAACDFETGILNEQLSAFLVTGLTNVVRSETPPPALSELLTKIEVLDEWAEKQRLSERHYLLATNESLRQFRLATLQSFYQSRFEQVRKEQYSTLDARIRKMKASELKRLELEFENKQKLLRDGPSSDIISKRLAWGVLEVRHES